MSDIAIRCQGISKQYRIGGRQRYKALRDTLTDALYAPFRRLRNVSQGPHVSTFTRSNDLDPHSNQLFWALQDVSFQLKRGEVVGVIGRNGAGKSTLLKILSRITEPTRGRVEIHGRVGSLLEVGTGFNPELTGRENILLNGAILGMKRAEILRRFDEIVAFAEVERFLDTPVKHYSSGMYLRLAFAVAAHLEPEILVVDEVLAVGDAEFQKKCVGKMSDVASDGRTVLFVSHNMNAVERLCGRVLLLDRGALVETNDDVRSAIMRYLNGDGQSSASVWTNRGSDCINDYFYPERLAVASLTPSAQVGQPFCNQYPIVISVDGEVRLSDPALNIGIGVYREGGELLFWSFTTDAAVARQPKLSPGKVRLNVRIPERLLNEGAYRVELLASLHYRAWLIEPSVNAPSLAFEIQGGLSDSPFWHSRRPGALAPVLEWQPAPLDVTNSTYATKQN